MTDSHVLVRVEGRIGRLTLNRPERINALTLEMIAAVRSALEDWATDDRVEAVLLDGAGPRGLCAGGDIRAVYEGIRGGAASPTGFWADEYRMNAAIAHYPKPYVAYMDGIVMGGGVGISAHGSVRVVTERSVVAMPENGIGLAPDVGALYMLSRAPGEMGTRAALVGARMDAAGAIHAGLADHYLPSDRLPELTGALVDNGAAALAAFVFPAPPAGPSDADAEWIARCYAGDSVEGIAAALRACPQEAAQADAELLLKMSPTSLKATLRAIRNAAAMTVDQVLDQDLRVCSRLALHHDLAEGIRAQIIDKDRNPRWKPDTLAAVDEAAVDALFAPLP